MNPADIQARLEALKVGGASPDEVEELLQMMQEGDDGGDGDANPYAYDKDEDWANFRGATAGRSVPLSPAVPFTSSGTVYNPGPPVDLLDVRFQRPRVVTVTFLADGTLAFAQVQTKIGAAPPFVRTVPMPIGMARSIQVYGSEVIVSAYVGNGTSTQPTAKNATAAVSPKGVDPLGDLFPQWVPQNGTLLSAYAGPANPGVLLGASGWLGALGAADTQEWVQAFDSTVAPTSGQSIPLVNLGPLTSAGMPFSFDRSLRPSVFFTSGLYWAVSKTGGVFTTPGAGATFAVQYDWSN